MGRSPFPWGRWGLGTSGRWELSTSSFGGVAGTSSGCFRRTVPRRRVGSIRRIRLVGSIPVPVEDSYRLGSIHPVQCSGRNGSGLHPDFGSGGSQLVEC